MRNRRRCLDQYWRVVGSGIGGGVGVITTGPAPCGGIVVGDVTKTPVPCGDIYECGIVPSGGQVITQPCDQE